MPFPVEVSLIQEAERQLGRKRRFSLSRGIFQESIRTNSLHLSHDLPRIASTTQQPRTWSVCARQCERMS